MSDLVDLSNFFMAEMLIYVKMYQHECHTAYLAVKQIFNKEVE